MKKIYTLFMLSFWAFLSSLSFADERHDAIINKYAETHSCAQETFYTLNEIVNNDDNLNNAYLVLTGQELIAQNNYLNDLLQRFPDIHVVLDVQEGDGLVLNGSLTFERDLAQYIRRLTIINLCQDVTAIGDDFLFQCVELTHLDLSFLSQVNRIENCFLSACSGLTQLDLSSLSQVTEIGTYFLSECTGLTQLDLSFLSQVNRIGASFLLKCSGLTHLDLSPLSQLTRIENLFLSNCSGLTHLDLSPLSQVTQIGLAFLFHCSGLTHLDLSPLSQVTLIERFFLSGCLGLTEAHHIVLPAYNAVFRYVLMERFLETTEIGAMIQEIYVEGYTPFVQRNMKSARK